MSLYIIGLQCYSYPRLIKFLCIQQYNKSIKTKDSEISSEKGMLLKNFIESYIKKCPRSYHNYLRSLERTNKIIFHHPVIASNYSNDLSQINLIANKQIPRNNIVFQISGEQSFNSRQFIGAQNPQVRKIEQNFIKAIEKMQVLQGDELQGVFKMMIQIYANQVSLNSGTMPLNSFAYLLDEGNQIQFPDHQKYQKIITSPHLFNIIKSSRNLSKRFHNILLQYLFNWEPQQKQFIKLFNTIRKLSRRIQKKTGDTQQNIDFIAPIVPSLKYSFQPNCQIVGKYFAHLRSSFYCIESIRQIQQGQQLSVGFREGLNNYDIFLRHGYLPSEILNSEKKSSNGQFMIIVDLLRDTQNLSLTENIDKKQQLLNSHKLKMKNLIKISQNGQLKNSDLKMLRILYTGYDEGEQSEKKDQQIYQFVSKSVVQNLVMLKNNRIKIDKKGESQFDSSDQVFKSIRFIERQEVQILEAFLERKKL